MKFLEVKLEDGRLCASFKGSQASTALHKYTSFCSHQQCGERVGARVIASGQALGLGESWGWAEMWQAFLICPFGGQATEQADSSERHSQSSGPQPEQVGGGLSLWSGW